MKIRSVNWNRHFERAQAERVEGNTQPHLNPSPTHKIWNVRNYKNGIAGAWYTVRLWWYDDDTQNARVFCNCYAGNHGNPCKHAAFVIDQELPELLDAPVEETYEDLVVSFMGRKFF